MNTHSDAYRTEWWGRNLEQLDREIGRMATICRAPLLEPGVVDRVLQDDDTMCGTKNAAAFAKLRDLLRMHFLVRQKTADDLGQMPATVLEADVIERLRKSFPDLGTHWPPA